MTIAASDASPHQTFKGEWLARLPGILENASEFERSILLDSEVSASEHSEAQRAILGCLDRAGVTVLEFAVDRHGLVQSASFALGEDAAAAIPLDRCESTFYRFVPEAYRIGLTPNDSNAALAKRVADCLIAQGYDVPEQPPEFHALSREVRDIETRLTLDRCYFEVEFQAP